jgi:hypothetical protein
MTAVAVGDAFQRCDGRAEPGHGMRSPTVGRHSVDKPANRSADRVRTRHKHHASVSHRGVLRP